MKQALLEGALQALLSTLLVVASARALVLPSATWNCTGTHDAGSIVVDHAHVFCAYGSHSGVTPESRVSFADMRQPETMSTYSATSGSCATSAALCVSQKQRPFYANTQYVCVCVQHALQPDGLCASVTPSGQVSPPNSNDVFECKPPSVLQSHPRACKPAATQFLTAYEYGVALVRAEDSADLYSQARMCTRYETGGDCKCRRGYERVHGRCSLCPLGSFCTDERVEACPGNMTTLYVGAGTSAECVCVRGAYRSEGARTCLRVPDTETAHYVDPCARVPPQDARTCDVLKQCAPGQFCRQGVLHTCADGEYRLDGTWCVPCPVGTFCRGGAKHTCPAHASTAGVGASSATQCICRPGHAMLSAEATVRCVKAEAHAAHAQPCVHAPHTVNANAHIVWWFAAEPLANTAAAVLEHLALAPVVDAVLRLHVRLSQTWHVLDLATPDDMQRDDCRFLKLHIHDSAALMLAACNSGDPLRGGSVAFALHGQALVAQTGFTWAPVLDSNSKLRNWSASPVRALLALHVCTNSMAVAVQNVTTFSFLDNTSRVESRESFVAQERCSWRLLFFEQQAFETVIVPSAENASTLLPLESWGRDGVTLALNATHHVHVDRLRRGDPRALALGGVDQVSAGAVVANRECGKHDAHMRKHTCAASDVVVNGVCTPCAHPFVSVSGICTACPRTQVCAADPSVRVLCPPLSQTADLNRTACVCPHGQIVIENTCQNVSRGWYASGSEAGARSCPPNTTTAHSGAHSASQCTCMPGYFVGASHRCELAPENTFAGGGGALSHCDASHITLGPGASRPEDCVCREGTYGRPGGQCLPCTYPHACPANTTVLGEHTRCSGILRQNAQNSRCVCPEGLYSDNESPPTCRKCDVGYFCNEVLGGARVRCPEQMTTLGMQAHTQLQCVCANAGSHKVVSVDGKMSCECNRVHYRHQGVCKPCPANSHAVSSAKGTEKCACDDGYHVAASGEPRGCVVCRPGHWCANSSVFECPRGTYGVIEGQRRERDCVRCSHAVRHMSGHGHPPTVPAHATCLTEFATVTGRGVAGFAGAGRARLTAVASAELDLTHALRDSAYRLASPNITSTHEQWSTHRQMRHVALQEHDLFHAALFAKLSRDAHEWPRFLNQTLEARNDAYAIVSAACFCVLNAHTLQQLHDTVHNFYCVLPRDVDADDPILIVQPWMLQALGLETKPRVRFSRSVQAAAVRSFVDGLAVAAHPMPFVLFPSETEDTALLAAAVPAGGGAFLQTLLRLFLMQTQPNVLGLIFRNVPCLQAQTLSFQAIPGAGFDAVEFSAGLCARCAPGSEFTQQGLGQCHACNTSLFDADAPCSGTQTLRMCTETADFACVQTQPPRLTSLCQNQKHDVVEQCDPSDRASPLRGCCRDDCTLVPGFYSFPPCSTICGDGIVAPPNEACEPGTSTPMCNVTCQFSAF